MLEPAPTVPWIQQGEVRGVDGSVAWGMTHPGIETVDLWVQDSDRRNMARLSLNRAGCKATADLLLEMGRTLPEELDDKTR